MDALEQLQSDVFYLLDSATSLQYTTVLLARPRVDPHTGAAILAPQIIEKQQAALSGNLKRNGKVGTCITILLPSEQVIEVEHKAQRVPSRQTVCIRIQENTLINMSSQGSRLSAESLTQLVWDQIDEYPFLGGHRLKWKRKEAVDVNPLAYEIYFDRDSDRVHRPRCMPIQMVIDGDLITLFSPTVLSLVYYTLDGSFPGLSNPNAQQFPILTGDGGVPLVDPVTGDYLAGNIAKPGTGIVLTAVAYCYDKGNPSPPFHHTF